MKKLFLLSLFVLLAGSMTTMAQHTVESIRKEYQEVHERIQLMSEDAMPQEYYNLHVRQNLPATGQHDVNTYMYYAELPGQADEVIYPMQYLQFATTKYNYAVREYYEEYLFDAKGQLTFAYSRYVGEEIDNVYELRLWFNGKRLLRAMAKENTSDDWTQPVFKDVYTGTSLPEKFKNKADELKSSAAEILSLFNNINSFPY